MPARLKLQRLPREQDTVRACLQLLGAYGIFCWRCNTTGVWDPAGQRFRKQHGRKGVSDILGILPGGRMLCVECKGRRGRLTPEQQHFLDTVREQGGLALVITDVTELLDALRQEGAIHG